VALRVEDLRAAEEYYRGLFSLDVAFREAETPDGWRTLPGGAGWDDAERAGIELGLVQLYRDGVRLALEAVDAAPGEGRLSHVGLFIDDDERLRLRSAARAAGCQIAVDDERALIFDDRFGVRWELNTFPYDDPPRLSAGAREDRWLDV
jgi:hypothetical protein